MRRMKKCCASLLLAICCLAAAGAPGQVGFATEEIAVKSALNTVKLEQTEEIGGLPNADLRVEAARGESEGAQFVVRSAAARNYTLTAGDLTGPGGSVLGKECVQIYVQIYGRTTKNRTSFATGWYPDALIPFGYVEARGENVLPAGKNQGFWVDVTVPTTAAAGVYTGAVELTVGNERISVPLTTTVYDFTMNAVPAMKSIYLIWTDWLIFGELDNTNAMYKTYYDELLKYNLQAQDLPARIGDIEGFQAAVREYYDRINAYAIPYQLVNSTTVDWELLRRYLRALADISLEDGKNYFDKAYYAFDKLYDEADQVPSRQETIWPSVNGTNALAGEVADELVAAGKIPDLNHEVAVGLKSVRHMLVSRYMEEFANPNLFFCPGYDHYYSTDEIAFYRQLAQSGTELFSYGALAWWPHSSTVIDDYLITARDIYWSRFEYDVTGDLFWCVNGYPNWSRWVGGANGGYAVVEDLYTTYSRDNYSDGDGWLFYPGKPYGSSTPFPSLRLMARRDGIDDYDYLAMLDSAYRQNYGTEAKEIAALIGSQVYSLGVSKLNFSGLQTARRSLADLLVLAQGDAKFAVQSVDRTDRGVSYTFRAAAGTTVRVNGRALSASTAAGAQTFAGELDYPEDGILRLEVEQGGRKQTAQIPVGRAPRLISDFETATDANLATFNNTNSQSAVSGEQAAAGASSLKLTFGSVLSGRSEARIAFEGGLADTDSLRLRLYNPTAEAITVYLGVRNKNGIPYAIDIVTLAPGCWTPLRLDQFAVVSTDPERLRAVTALTISVPNPDSASTVLYLDGFYRT